MPSNTEVITKESFLKFFDPNYGSNGNEELDTKARESMTPEQMWESIKRIEELDNQILEAYTPMLISVGVF